MNDITEVDRLNAEIADLKRTIEWYQGRTGIMMGAAARGEIVGAPVRGAGEVPRLIELLNAIKPNFGDVGSRDVDVKAQRERIEEAIAILSAAPVPLPVEPQLIYPPTMTPLLGHVLGFPNFRTGPIAHVFQKAGFDIPTKCEAEQAFVLDRMIRAVLTHGEGWAAAFEDDLRAQFAIIEERKVAATPSEQAEKPK